jgi:hypothetical protein
MPHTEEERYVWRVVECFERYGIDLGETGPEGLA